MADLGVDKAEASRTRNTEPKKKPAKTPILERTTPTGERVDHWLMRRIGVGLGRVPAALALQNAITPMSDFELENVTKIAAVVPVPTPSPTPQARTAQGDSVSVFGHILNAAKKVGSGVATATDFLVPEDIEDFVGNAKAALIGGPDSSGIDLGYEGAIPSVVGPPTRAAHVVGNLAIDASDAVTDLATSLAPGGSKPGDVLKQGLNPTQVDDYLKVILKTPAGDNLAADMGLSRDSLEFKLVAGAVNFWLDNVATEGLGAFGKAAKGAGKLPAGSKMAIDRAEDLGLLRSKAIGNTLTQFLFDRHAMTTEKLVATKGKDLVDRLGRLASKGGDEAVGAIKGAFPSIPTQMAREMAESPAEVERILVAGLNGDLLPVTRADMEFRLTEIAKEKQAVMAAERAPSIGFAAPSKSRMVKELDDEATKITSVLKGQVANHPSRVILESLPGTSTFTDFRTLARAEGGVFSRTAKVLSDARWVRHISRPLPAGGISVTDRDAGAQAVRAWGELLGMKTKDIDRFVGEYAKAGPGEVYEVATRLLREGGKNLPGTTGERLTQIHASTVGQAYGITEEGLAVGWYTRGSDGVLAPAPLHSGQIPTEIPMPDPRAIIEARQLAPRFNDWAQAEAEKTSSLIAKGVLHTSRGLGNGVHALRKAEESFVTKLWTPAVLARLGWTAKVIGVDEHARLAAMDVPGLWNHPFQFVSDRVQLKRLRTAAKLRAAGKVDEALAIEKRWSNPAVGFMVEAPEEIYSDFGRDMAGLTRRQGRVVRKTDRGFHQAFHDELVQMHNAKEVQYLAAHGPEKTISWLKTHPRGQEIMRRMSHVLDRVEVNGSKGATVEDYVANLNAHLKRLAPTPELRHALATGRVNVGGARGTVWIGDKAVVDFLKTHDAPAAVRGSGAFIDKMDMKGWERFRNGLMDWLGSKPSNASRSQVYGYVFDREVKSLVSRGIPKEMAEAFASKRVAEVTNELLYDLTQRTSFDQVHKGLVPFFPAHREVLKAWGSQIPQRLGGDLGHLVLTGKVTAMTNLAKKLGVYRDLEDSEGNNIGAGVHLFGQDWPLRNLFFISSTPAPGPIRQAFIKKMAVDMPAIKEFEERMGWFTDSNISLGPAWLSRAWRGTFGDLPPWDKAFGTHRHQQAQWDLALGRQLKNHSAEILEIAKLPKDQQRAALAIVLSEAREDAKDEFLWRGLKGFVLPVQPLSLGDAQDQAVRDAVEGLDENAKADFYRDLMEHNPVAYLRLASQSYLTTAEVKDEKGAQAFWDQLDSGQRDVMGAEAFSRYLLGRANYTAIRHDYAAKLAIIGKGSARNLLLNYAKVREAAVDRDQALDALIYQSKDPDSPMHGWGERYEETLRLYHPLDYKEWKFRETNKFIRESLAMLPEDVRAEIDTKALGGLRAAISEEIKDIFDNGGPQAGPQGTMTKWFDSVYGPYLDNIEKLYAERDKILATRGGDPSEVFEKIRRYREGLKEVTVDGVKMPTPEAFAWGGKTPDEKIAQKLRWAMDEPAWLTTFQREKLGQKVGPEVTQFWNTANEVRIGLDAAFKNESSTLRSRAHTAYEAWAASEAKKIGVPYTNAPAYQRLTDYKLAKGETWERVVQVADGIRVFLAAEDRKRPNAEGQDAFNRFIEAKMAEDGKFAVLMDSLWKASFLKDKSLYDDFIPFLFWS